MPLPLREGELHFQPRVWGSRDLRAWYPERGLEPEPVGEVWLTALDAPVLIKLLFPEAPLSVQVHPDDAYAAAHGLGRGKSEAWYVLSARPGARLGVGLRPGATLAELERATRAGGTAELLDWIAVAPGDLINVPAGTVHAIGPGVVLLEVQQPSDNTFRLDDFGRGRELHLDRGLAVARLTSGGGCVHHALAPGASGPLLATPWFRFERHCVHGDWQLPSLRDRGWIINVSPPDETSITLPRRGHLVEVEAGAALAGSGAGTLITVGCGTV